MVDASSHCRKVRKSRLVAQRVWLLDARMGGGGGTPHGTHRTCFAYADGIARTARRTAAPLRGFAPGRGATLRLGRSCPAFQTRPSNLHPSPAVTSPIFLPHTKVQLSSPHFHSFFHPTSIRKQDAHATMKIMTPSGRTFMHHPFEASLLRRYCRGWHACGRLAPRCGSHQSATALSLRPQSTTAPPQGHSYPTLSAREFASLTPMLLLQQSLQQYTELDGTDVAGHTDVTENHCVISRTAFCHFCAAAHVEDPSAALADLEAAGVVVLLDGGDKIHLRPALYLETLELVRRAGAPPTSAAAAASPPPPSTSSSFLLEEAERRVAELAQQEMAMREQLRPAIARAARWRRTAWGGALFYAGAQLAVISRLTYFDLDWDIMEPVSYCLTIANALVFFAYYLRYNDEHSYSAFDQRFLPRKVRQYAPKDFDWTAYTAVCEKLVAEREMLDRLREWAQRH